MKDDHNEKPPLCTDHFFSGIFPSYFLVSEACTNIYLCKNRLIFSGLKRSAPLYLNLLSFGLKLGAPQYLNLLPVVLKEMLHRI